MPTRIQPIGLPIGQALSAAYPPFSPWYEYRMNLKERPTIERQFLGLSYVPACDTTAALEPQT